MKEAFPDTPFIMRNNGRIFKNIFFIHLFIFERQRQSTSGGEAERAEDTEPEAGSGLRAVSAEPHVGLELTDREIVT